MAEEQTPQKPELPKPELNEIATTGDGRDITKPYVSALQYEPYEDTVLAAKGGGLELYEEVLRDDQVHACFQQRRLSVVSREWQVDPGAEDPLSVKAADFFTEMLKGLEGFDDHCNKMLYGIFYGYGIGECMWAQDGRNVFLDRVKVRRARRFRYTTDGKLKLLTRTNPQGELMPDRKFWTFSVGADNDDALYGLGLGHWCYWPAYFKRYGMKFWLIFLEKFGMPTAVGKYNPGTPDGDVKKLLQAAAAIATDSGVAIPNTMLLELLQAQRSGTGDYDTLHQRMDAAIAKVILSQTMTTDDGSSLAQGQVHFDVREEVSKSDSDLLHASFRAGPVKWLTEWNFPGAVPPRVYRNFEQPDDLDKKAERDQRIVQMGFKPSLDYINETYGGEWEISATPATPIPGDNTAAGNGAAFAEGAAPAGDAIDKSVDAVLAGSESDMASIRAQVDRILQASTDYQDFLRRLHQLWPQLDTNAIQERVARLSFQARLGGLAGDGLRAGMDDPDPRN
jgi:phage gp29-like protein